MKSLNTNRKKRFWRFIERNDITMCCFFCKVTVSRYLPEHHHKKATIDHYIPLSRGGTNNRSNLVIACNKCNNKKGDSIW